MKTRYCPELPEQVFETFENFYFPKYGNNIIDISDNEENELIDDCKYYCYLLKDGTFLFDFTNLNHKGKVNLHSNLVFMQDDKIRLISVFEFLKKSQLYELEHYNDFKMTEKEEQKLISIHDFLEES